MSEPLRVGVVGCGMIASRYVADSHAFEHWQPVACADLDRALGDAFAAEHGLRPLAVDELIADPEVELVLNLTPPAAHAAVVGAVLAAGKHAYTEKPLAATAAEARALVADADRRGLRLGCAPDTFLGSAYECGRRLLEEGAIGRPLGVTAEMLVGGPDGWHPNAEMFYRAGGGPVLDIAPYYLTAIVSLLGPIAAVTGFTATPTPERTLAAGPRAGETIAVDVPTHAAAVLRLEQGALATLTVSFEARGQYLSGLVVHGTEGSLVLPDANAFGGDVVLRRGRDHAETVAYESRGAQETRGIGIEELVQALRAGRPHRASGELALHVLEAAEAMAAGAGEPQAIAPGVGGSHRRAPKLGAGRSRGREPGEQLEVRRLVGETVPERAAVPAVLEVAAPVPRVRERALAVVGGELVPAAVAALLAVLEHPAEVDDVELRRPVEIVRERDDAPRSPAASPSCTSRSGAASGRAPSWRRSSVPGRSP